MQKSRIVLLSGIITSICVFSSCGSKNDNAGVDFANEIDSMYVSINPYSNNPTSFFEIWDSVVLIPLETDGKALISSYDKVQIYKTDYYILDIEQACVWCFDKNGAFKKKIQRLGRGPGEYTRIEDFQINESHQTIELLSPLGYIYQYDLDGNFQNVISVSESLSAVHFFHNLTNDVIVFFSLYENNKISYYSRSQNRLFFKHFTIPGNIVSSPLVNPNKSPFSTVNRISLFTSYYSAEVYQLSNQKLVKHRKIEFGDKTLNSNSIPDNLEMESLALYLLKSKYCHSIRYYIENDKYIFLRYMCERKWFTSIISLQNETIYNIHKFSEGVVLPGDIVFSDEGVFGIIDPMRISILVNPRVLSPKMIDIYESIDINSNPLIVKYYFKSDI